MVLRDGDVSKKPKWGLMIEPQDSILRYQSICLTIELVLDSISLPLLYFQFYF